MPEIQLIVWGGVLNAIWEFAQSALYTDHDRGWWYVTWTRLHCTVGDVMILLSAFWIVSFAFRTRSWAAGKRHSACVLFIVSGLGYTIFSEWWNTSIRDSWQYADVMPVVFGIGLSPVAQWIVIPPVVLRLIQLQTSALNAGNTAVSDVGSATSVNSPQE